MPFFPYTGNTGGGFTPVPPRAALVDELLREVGTLGSRLPTLGRVRTLTDRLRVSIHLLTDEVETAARGREADDPVRTGALAAVEEAHHRLRLGPGDGYTSAITFSRTLGRAVEELLHHRQQLHQDKR